MQEIEEKLIHFAKAQKVVQYFEDPIKLKSGELSNWYVNWRKASEDCFLLEELASYVLEFLKKHEITYYDCFYGVPEGATKLAFMCNFLRAKNSDSYAPQSHQIPMGRGRPKNHGLPNDTYFLGRPKGDVIVLEDTITTGQSLLECLRNLHENQISVPYVIGLTDRSHGAFSKRIQEFFPKICYQTLCDFRNLTH